MKESEIKEKFNEILNERGIYSKINVSRDVVYNWKKGRGPEPTLGQMLEALYRLEMITVHVSK